MRETNATERLGVNAVERAFLELGWLFREQSINDYGIDAQAEPKSDGIPTGQLIALQIKTGRSYFRKRGDNVVFYGDRRHLDYWQHHILPVFIILHNPESEVTLWQRVERNLVEEHKDGRWSILIPLTNKLDAAAVEYIRHGISSDPASVRRFRLAADFPLMREVSDKEAEHSVFLRIEEWINKSLNFRDSALVYSDPEGRAAHQFSRWLAFSDIASFMKLYFPWLDYQHVSSEETVGSEVEEHVLEVKVNVLGRSFLEVEDYVETGETPQDERAYYGETEEGYSEDDYFDEDKITAIRIPATTSDRGREFTGQHCFRGSDRR